MINVSEKLPCCYIGLPQWNHPEWSNGPLAGNSNTHPLGRYARYFSSVEGNTTFYGLPSPEAVKRWKDEIPDHFRFCFKFPQSITHHLQLSHCHQELKELFECMALFEEKLGLLCIQLPESFSPRSLPKLNQFLESLPVEFNYSIEVRHTGFFKKDESERQFNRMIMARGINRTTFDTRALFTLPADDHATREALTAKPNLPVHVLATGLNPMVRLITAMNWQESTAFLSPWINKATQWLDEGRSPFFFFHTPDNAAAPIVAQHFVQLLSAQRPNQVCFTDWPIHTQQQSTLF